jgi:two-component system sensor histidine kinase ChiS
VTASTEPTQLLNRALRSTATRASELACGGAVLLFATLPVEGQGAAPRLRSAAGFASLDDARAAAGQLGATVAACMGKRTVQTVAAPAAMGANAAGGVQVVPIAVDGRCYGALAVASPAPLATDASDEIEALAAGAALQIDHQRLARSVQALEKQLSEHQHATNEQGDEILKLSETLFAQDIELLRSNEKLGQIEKIKSDFIEKMSRELRTPLNSIIEAIVSVLAGENESLSETAKQSMRRALDEGTTYQRTLQNILDLWRIKQGELPIEIQELNFSEVVDEAIFSVQDTLAGKPVEIDKQLPEPFPRIKSDLAKVNQVLFLLLDNAAKFTQKGTITITGAVEDGVLRCRIEDTGIGICPDDQGYIFDEFFQVDDQASARYRGAGLGLSLARDLLTLMDGACVIESEAGRGTIATIEIPVLAG